jgi:hypothetical protein
VCGLLVDMLQVSVYLRPFGRNRNRLARLQRVAWSNCSAGRKLTVWCTNYVAFSEVCSELFVALLSLSLSCGADSSVRGAFKFGGHEVLDRVLISVPALARTLSLRDRKLLSGRRVEYPSTFSISGRTYKGRNSLAVLWLLCLVFHEVRRLFFRRVDALLREDDRVICLSGLALLINRRFVASAAYRLQNPSSLASST